MNLETRYDLLESVPDFRVDQTVAGRERFSGRPVMLHLLGGGSPEANQQLFGLIDQLNESNRAKIFETGTYVGIACAVTDELPGRAPFRGWLTQAAVETPAAPKPAKAAGEFTLSLAGLHDAPRGGAPAPPEPAKAGEFTEFLKVSGREQAPAAPPAPPMPSRNAPPAGTPPPGEFTLFLNSLKSPATSNPVPKPATPPAENRKPGRDEYVVPERTVVPPPPTPQLQSDIPTRVFSEPQDSAPPRTDIARNEGEFTRFLKGSSAPAPGSVVSPNSPPRQEQPPPPDPFPPAGSPGEFTQWLEGPQHASKPSKR